MRFIITHCRIAPGAPGGLQPVDDVVYFVDAQNEQEARQALLSEYYHPTAAAGEVLVVRRAGVTPMGPTIFRPVLTGEAWRRRRVA